MLGEGLAVLLGNLVLALTSFKVNDRNAICLIVRSDRFRKLIPNLTQQGWRRNLVTPVFGQKVDQLLRDLQVRFDGALFAG